MAESEKGGPPLSRAGRITIIILVLFLLWAIWYAVRSWTAMASVHMSPLGWLFLSMGIIVTFAVGALLMGLVFYSARHDMDR